MYFSYIFDLIMFSDFTFRSKMLEAVNVIEDISFLIFISVVNKELKHSHTYLFS
jgi:hypothetical protein